MKKYLFTAIASLVVSVTWYAWLPASQASTANPAIYGLKEGDLISAIFSNDPDVYIINQYGYKRLFLNPDIFMFYGHLGGYFNVKLVPSEVRDAFTTSGLFRNCEENDHKVYGIDIEGEDSGKLRWVNVPADNAASNDPEFFKKVFCINKKEFDWYPKGNEFHAVKEVPAYERMQVKATMTTDTGVKQNMPLKHEGKAVICHHPGEAGTVPFMITVDAEAVSAHIAHGDTVGVCAGYVPPPSPVPTILPTATPLPTAVPTPTPVWTPCTDSDGGDDIYRQGTIRGLLLVTGQMPYDYCLSYAPNVLVEYSCQRSGGFSGTIVEGLYSKSVTCPNGCLNGACVSGPIVPSISPPPSTSSTVVTGALQVLAPNGREQWTKGSAYAVQWNSPFVSGFNGDRNLGWTISLQRLNGMSWTIGTVLPLTTVSYQWTVPTTVDDAADYKVRVALVKNCTESALPCLEPERVLPLQATGGGVFDVSDNLFSIFSPYSTTPIPTPVVTPTPMATSTPIPLSTAVTGTLTLITPNGGEIWQRGNMQSVTWIASPGISNLNVYLDDQVGVGSYLVGQNITNGNSFAFTPDRDVYGYQFPDSIYKVHIVSVLRLTPTPLYAQDISDMPLKIVTAPGSACSITVLSPNGGETQYRGQSYNVTWSTNGCSTNASIKMSASLVNTYPYQYVHHPTLQNNANDGSEAWTVPSGSVPGRYHLLLCVTATQGIACDWSDTPFTISDSAPVPTPTPTATPAPTPTPIPSPTPNPAPTGKGACILRDAYTSMPVYTAPDVGTGYAKANKMGATLTDIRLQCTQSVYDALKASYCATNTHNAQQGVVLYDSTGTQVNMSTCGPDNMNCADVVCGTPTPTESVPSAPVNANGYFLANGVYGPSVNMIWTDTASNETEYRVYERPSGSPSWTLKRTYSASAVSVQFAGYITGIYDYKASACNSAGCGDSNVITVIMGGSFASPQCKTNASDNVGICVTWPNGAETLAVSSTVTLRWEFASPGPTNTTSLELKWIDAQGVMRGAVSAGSGIISHNGSNTLQWTVPPTGYYGYSIIGTNLRLIVQTSYQRPNNGGWGILWDDSDANLAVQW